MSSDIRREYASWVPSLGGFLGTTEWEETPGQTQNMLEGLYILSVLGGCVSENIFAHQT